MPKSLNDCQYWKYGVDDYASGPRHIFGSISLPCCTDKNVVVWMRHLVLDGSSQWVVGQNVMQYGDICQISSLQLVLQPESGDKIAFSLVKIDRLLYMPSMCFGTTNTAALKSMITAFASSARPWTDVKKSLTECTAMSAVIPTLLT